MLTRIVTDSTSYIPLELLQEYQITIVSLSVSFDTETFREVDLKDTTFYEMMAKHKTIPTSSQPTLLEICKSFETSVKNGDAVIGVFISSEMSGTYSTALLAKKMVLEKYPEAQIEVVDSRSNSMELGFAVLAGAKAAKAGQPLEKVVNEIERMIRRTRFVFAPEVLDYLRKGGRIGGAAALIGSLLQIRPILTVNNGKTAVLAKVRTRARAFEEMIRLFLEDVKSKGLGEIYVHHINNEPGAYKLSALIKQSFDCPISICSIGPVIGLHVGPGTLGLVYYTKEDLR